MVGDPDEVATALVALAATALLSSSRGALVAVAATASSRGALVALAATASSLRGVSGALAATATALLSSGMAGLVEAAGSMVSPIAKDSRLSYPQIATMHELVANFGCVTGAEPPPMTAGALAERLDSASSAGAEAPPTTAVIGALAARMLVAGATDWVCAAADPPLGAMDELPVTAPGLGAAVDLVPEGTGF